MSSFAKICSREIFEILSFAKISSREMTKKFIRENKFSQKLIPLRYIIAKYAHQGAYQWVRNVSFSENFAYTLNS